MNNPIIGFYPSLRCWARGRIVAAIVLILGLAALGAWFQSRLRLLMDEHGLQQRLAPDQRMSPEIAAATIMLGGFRGAIADVLFLRLVALQHQGKYHEMAQLASAIAMVQPEFTGALAFLAWNMAYNVSVTFDAPADRWRWLNLGIQLLRDRALANDPHNPLLYQELSWIYLHKVGGDTDRFSPYYRVQLARRMQMSLGTSAPFDWQALANAAASERELQERLRTIGVELENVLLQARLSFTELHREFARTGGLPSALNADAIHPQAQNQFVAYLRRTALDKDWNLDPVKVIIVNECYGEMDYRLPAAHALYWSHWGNELKTTDGGNPACQRMICEALKQMFFAGKIRIVTASEPTLLAPNPATFDPVCTAYDRAITRNAMPQALIDGYENFLKEALVVLFSCSEIEKANQCLRSLRENPWFNHQARDCQTLDDFIQTELLGDPRARTPERMRDVMHRLLHESFAADRWGDRPRAAVWERLAADIHRQYFDLYPAADSILPRDFIAYKNQVWQRIQANAN